MTRLRIYLNTPFFKARGWKALRLLEDWGKKNLPASSIPTFKTKLDRLTWLFAQHKDNLPRGMKGYLIITREARGLRASMSHYRGSLKHFGERGGPQGKRKQVSWDQPAPGAANSNFRFYSPGPGEPRPNTIIHNGLAYDYVDGNMYRRRTAPASEVTQASFGGLTPADATNAADLIHGLQPPPVWEIPHN
jgi:hypothetical protein